MRAHGLFMRLFFRLLDAQQRFDRRDQFPAIHRLGKVRIGPVLQPAQAIFGLHERTRKMKHWNTARRWIGF